MGNQTIATMNQSDIFIQRPRKVFVEIFNFLHCIVDWLESTQIDRTHFEELRFFFHLLLLQTDCLETIPSLHHKQCLSLLSCSDWIRCDVLFKECGDSSKQIGSDQDAFIFYNHFVDICDFIDDPSANDIDYSDFDQIDSLKMTIPHKIIPSKHIFAERQREQIRDWVLEMLATAEIDPSLSCFSDNEKGQKLKNKKCIVSGATLYSSDCIIKCRECQKSAIKSAWNLYVDEFKICPWCKKTQAPIY